MNKKYSDTTGKLWINIGVGVGVSAAVGLLLAILGAIMVSNGKAGEGACSMIVCASLLVASLVGGFVSGIRQMSNRLLTSILSAAGYYWVLLCVGLALSGGKLDNGIITACLVLGGGVAGGLLFGRAKSPGYKRMKFYKRRH